jgi:hypothetical protein
VDGVSSHKAAQPPLNKRKYHIMKALALSSVIAVGLFFAGSALADSSTYNSKTTQNVSFAPASGGAFEGSYLSSKSGSRLNGPTVVQAGKTSRTVACSRPMDAATCAIHCGVAKN